MKALSSHPLLEELHISSENSSSEMLLYLPALFSNTKIKKFVTDGLGSLLIQDFVMDKLKIAIGNNTTLEHLDLTSTQIGNLHLALEGLGKNRSLRTLILNSTTLRPPGLLHLAAALKYNINLRKLCMNNNA